MSRRDPPLLPEHVLLGYAQGLFPMADHKDRIAWFSPDPRGIFELDGLKLSRSLRQRIRRGEYEIRINTAFEQVIDECAVRDEGTWISTEIRAVYVELYRRGFAHSVECWHADQLAGGLYGVSIGGAFFGESMFTRRTDASKVALVALVERMRARGMALLDTQWVTPHLTTLGAIEIPREEYLERLQAAVRMSCTFADGPAAAP